MDCSLGRQRNPFCYIFSLACLLLPVCMWWRDVISTHSAETSDNSHYTIPVWATFTARTRTRWIWKHPTRGLTQKDISTDAAGVGKHCARSGKERAPGCQMMLSTKLHRCHQAHRRWGLPSCNVEWKIQRRFWCHTYRLRGLGWSSAESKVFLIFQTTKVKNSSRFLVLCPRKLMAKCQGAHRNGKQGSGIAALVGCWWA